MKLVAGSYEKFLWGWQVGVKKSSLDVVFSHEAHQGPVKCIDGWGSIVATGGSDDIIKVFDVNARKGLGSLHGHKGSITGLQFFRAKESPVNRPTNLFSSSEDGTIGVWDCDFWTHLKSLRHKSAVNSVAVHNSGKVALAVDKGRNLKMWNLCNGRASFSSKFSSEGTLIKFSPQLGAAYAVVKGMVLEIFDVCTGEIVHTYEHEKPILCLAQKEDNLIVSGGEDCTIRAWDHRSGKMAIQFPKAHTRRVKGVSALNAPESPLIPHFFASASSDGSVKIWDTRIHRVLEDGASSIAAIEATTSARLTCLVSCGAATKLESNPPCVGGVDARKESRTDVSKADDGVPKGVVQAGKEDAERKRTKKGKISVKVQRSSNLALKKRKRHPKAGGSSGAGFESKGLGHRNDDESRDGEDGATDPGAFEKAEKEGYRKDLRKKMKSASKVQGSLPRTLKKAKRHKIPRAAKGACRRGWDSVSSSVSSAASKPTGLSDLEKVLRRLVQSPRLGTFSDLENLTSSRSSAL